VDPKAETDSYTHEGPVISVAKSVEREEVKKIKAEKVFGPDVSWGGFETKYFIAALIPQNPSLSSMVVSLDSRNMVTTSLRGPKHLIPAGQAGLFSYTPRFSGGFRTFRTRILITSRPSSWAPPCSSSRR
jgi:YidC/Oxa1 family membrane protein insertase